VGTLDGYRCRHLAPLSRTPFARAPGDSSRRMRRGVLARQFVVTTFRQGFQDVPMQSVELNILRGRRSGHGTTRGRTPEAQKAFRVVYTAVETRAPRPWKSQVGWSSGRSAATNRGGRRRIGALPIADSLSLVRTQRQVKVCPVGKGSPAGTKVSSPAGWGSFFPIEGKDPRRDGTLSPTDGTTSPARIRPSLTPVPEMTWDDESVGRDTFGE
jgi:hypothetical protein